MYTTHLKNIKADTQKKNAYTKSMCIIRNYFDFEKFQLKNVSTCFTNRSELWYIRKFY